MADKIAPTLDELKEIFQEYDKDGDGEITVSELETAARRIYDKDVSPAHIAEIFKAVDANSDGTIDFEEFLQMMSTIGEDGDGKALVDAFREFDVNGDGFISLAELKLVLSRFGQRQTDEELAEILRVADKNGDGSIDYEEFVKMMDNED